jgi:LmbE family N-acetylglucosaminyl deacetylase
VLRVDARRGSAAAVLTGPRVTGDGLAVRRPLAERLDQAAAGGRGVLVLSPHLDDAVLSCGALLSRLAGRMPVTVATVFTEATPPPHTWSARAFLAQCAVSDAAVLYADRRQEDVEVLTALGVEHVHLGVADALFRRREVWPTVDRLGRVVPEVVHRYPTFRFHIAKGRVSRGDWALVDRLQAEVRTLARGIDAALILSPVGVGRHVDHLLTRTLAERQPEPAVFYSDFPYCQQDAPDANFLRAHRLTPVPWDQDIGAKERLIKGYRSQVGALFPAGIPPAVPETYFMAEGRRHVARRTSPPPDAASTVGSPGEDGRDSRARDQPLAVGRQADASEER